jgi:hypothetical protein
MLSAFTGGGGELLFCHALACRRAARAQVVLARFNKRVTCETKAEPGAQKNLRELGAVLRADLVR